MLLSCVTSVAKRITHNFCVNNPSTVLNNSSFLFLSPSEIENGRGQQIWSQVFENESLV